MNTFQRLSNSLRYRVRLIGRIILRNRTNAPFLSGDSFAKLAHVVIKEGEISRFTTGDFRAQPRIIFIESHLYSSISSSYLQKIDYRHILIFGNSDFNFDERPEVSEKCVAVFCQNASFKPDSRFKLLPIGLENLKLCGSGFPRFHKYSNKTKVENRILFPPISPTNPIRISLRKQAEDRQDIFDLFYSILRRSKYFKLTRKYRFIFVPEGNGYDTHRLWEVLYQGSFPVALRTPWSQNVENLGIPILLFDTFNELTESRLLKFIDLNGHFHPAKCSLLWTDFWEAEFSYLLETTSGN